MSTIKPRDIYIIRDQDNGNQRTVVYGEQLREKCAPNVVRIFENLPYNGKNAPARIGALSITKTQTMA
jgi:hypothetical protein